MSVIAGLRGAMTYALAYSLPLNYEHRDLFLATAASVVLLTVTIFGSLTVPMINFLEIPKQSDQSQTELRRMSLGTTSMTMTMTMTMATMNMTTIDSSSTIEDSRGRGGEASRMRKSRRNSFEKKYIFPLVFRRQHRQQHTTSVGQGAGEPGQLLPLEIGQQQLGGHEIEAPSTGGTYHHHHSLVNLLIISLSLA